MLKEQNICSCIDLLVSRFLLVYNICAPQAGWAGQTERRSVPLKHWMPSSLCPADENRIFSSDCLIFVLSYWILTSIWAIDCFKSSSASVNELDKFQFG